MIQIQLIALTLFYPCKFSLRRHPLACDTIFTEYIDWVSRCTTMCAPVTNTSCVARTGGVPYSERFAEY